MSLDGLFDLVGEAEILGDLAPCCKEFEYLGDVCEWLRCALSLKFLMILARSSRGEPSALLATLLASLAGCREPRSV